MKPESLKVEDLFSVKGKVVLVVGVGGLGSVLARGFAENGASMAIASYSQDHIDESVKECSAFGVPARGYKADVSIRTQAEEMVLQVEKDFGRIDVLLFTTGIAPLGPTLSFSHVDFVRTMEVNFYGCVYVNAACGRIMQKNGWGRIINISSIDQYTVNCVDDMPYSASKSAMAASTRHFAVDLAKNGVTVNNVAPVWIWTPMMERRPGDYMKQAAATIPMARCSWPEDYMGICLYLASEAGGYMTGQTLLVDGGWSVYRAFAYSEE